MAATQRVEREGIGAAGFLVRLALALVLVYATYNP